MIAVVGLSHKSAPIGVREHAALSPDRGNQLLADLLDHDEIDEALVISTCNRVEIIASRSPGHPTESSLAPVAKAAEEVLLGYAPQIKGHLYSHTGEDAIKHLFRVACSLDSLVMGEPQILGQLKLAFEMGRKLGTVGGSLNRAVSHALRTAKRVRTETALGAGQVSVPSVAIDLARQIFGDLLGRRALLVGSGQMGETAAKLLANAGVELGVVGRNQKRVTELAKQLGAEAFSFEELSDQVAAVDVIITTTSAPHYVITHEQLAAVRKKRRGRSLFLIDLAVPRDVDPKVDELDSVFLYNVDDLSQIVAETLSSRQREAEAAEHIVLAETANFARALYAEQATPTIVSLRAQFGSVLEAELERSLRTKLKHLPDTDRDALSKMLESAINKLLHPTTRHLRGLAEDSEAQAELDQCVTALRDAFALRSHGTQALSLESTSVRPPGVQADDTNVHDNSGEPTKKRVG